MAIVTALFDDDDRAAGPHACSRGAEAVTRVGLGWILISQMFCWILIIIPLFLLLRDWKLTNSGTFGLVVVYMVWARRSSSGCSTATCAGSPDLEEAATVDGATRFQILTGIIAPLLMPGIVVTTLFAFVTAWNEFFFALVILESLGPGRHRRSGSRSTWASRASCDSALAAAALLASNLPSLLYDHPALARAASSSGRSRATMSRAPNVPLAPLRRRDRRKAGQQ